MLVSAGFDGHYTDPVGELALSMQGYARIFSKILSLTSQLCSGKLVATLEGGYSQNFLGRIATAAIARMADVPYSVHDTSPVAQAKVRKRAEQVINSVRRIQSAFWQL